MDCFWANWLQVQQIQPVSDPAPDTVDTYATQRRSGDYHTTIERLNVLEYMYTREFMQASHVKRDG
jgi:hypothetical protein